MCRPGAWLQSERLQTGGAVTASALPVEWGFKPDKETFAYGTSLTTVKHSATGLPKPHFITWANN